MNGKYEARKRVRAFCPNMRRAKSASVPFQVAEGDARPDRQPFELVELRLVAVGDLLVAVAHARQDDPHRRRVIRVHGRDPAHGMDLPRRGVRAQHDRVVAAPFRLDEIGILHIPGGMTDLEVEQLEVVFVALHFARAEDLEAHLAEDAVQFAQGLRIGMQAAQRESAAPAG